MEDAITPSALNGEEPQVSSDVTTKVPLITSHKNEKNKNKTHRASTTTRLLGQLMMDKIKKDDEGYSGGNGSWVIGVLFLERNPTLEVVRNLITERLVSKMARFRSRMVVGRVSTYYKEAAEIDFEYHIPYAFTPGSEAPWSRDKLFSFIGDLNGFKYDLTKPLWRFVLVPEMDDGTAAVISIVNHAIGDGLAQVEVLFSILDVPEANPNALKEMKHSGKRKAKPTFGPFTRAKIFMGGVIHGMVAPFSAPDPPNSLKLKDSTKPSAIKLLAATEPISLAQMKELKNKFDGATLNDIMMAVMTLSLKAYFKEVGELKKNFRVTGQFPISIRGKGQGGLKNGEPHNKFSYGFFTFDFKTESRIALVYSVKAQVDRIKVSPAPLVTDRLAKALIKVMPRRMFLDTVINTSNIGTAQLSNVPGPQGPVYLAGIKVVDQTFFLFSPLGMYFGILTYNGTVSAAINLDASLNVDPKQIAKHWKHEFDALYQEAMAVNGTIPAPKSGCYC